MPVTSSTKPATSCDPRPPRTVPRIGMLRLPRLLWLAAGLAGGYGAVRLSSPWLLTAWLAPDLAMLAGGLRPIGPDGRMVPAAVRAYNAAHSLAGPALLSLAGLAGSRMSLALAALWFCHIAIDRSFGYGLRAPDGTQRG